MRRELSAFLDFVRLIAAFVVFLGHVEFPQFGGSSYLLLQVCRAESHSAVVVFFVLSGFVISWAARQEGSAANYVLARGARICSVAIPALVLTYVLDVATGNITYQHLQPWKYVPVFLTFSTDFWFLKENAFSNSPWWSLCYEVWYYVVFGIAFFGRGRWKYAGAAVCLAMMGPRLWLLFPLWLLGVGLHRLPALPLARFLALASVALIVVLKLSGVETVLNNFVDVLMHGFAKAQLRYSQFFVGDYLFAALIGLLIVAVRDAELGFLARLQWVLAAGASVSFSLYLTHFPLLLAIAHVLGKHALVNGAATLLCAVLFGVVFERNKRVARRAIAGLWLFLSGRNLLPFRAPAGRNTDSSRAHTA